MHEVSLKTNVASVKRKYGSLVHTVLERPKPKHGILRDRGDDNGDENIEQERCAIELLQNAKQPDINGNANNPNQRKTGQGAFMSFRALEGEII